MLWLIWLSNVAKEILTPLQLCFSLALLMYFYTDRSRSRSDNGYGPQSQQSLFQGLMKLVENPGFGLTF